MGVLDAITNYIDFLERSQRADRVFSEWPITLGHEEWDGERDESEWVPEQPIASEIEAAETPKVEAPDPMRPGPHGATKTLSAERIKREKQIAVLAITILVLMVAGLMIGWF